MKMLPVTGIFAGKAITGIRWWNTEGHREDGTNTIADFASIARAFLACLHGSFGA